MRICYLQANLRFGPNKKTHFAFYQIKLAFVNKIQVIVSEAAGSLGIVYTNSYSLGNRNLHFPLINLIHCKHKLSRFVQGC